MGKPKVAVHKFTSCDGCQLAFLNAGEALLQLSALVDLQHFSEAGKVDTDVSVDIAFVEGSISTPDELERIKKVRAQSQFLITIGACATAGGIQALRNAQSHQAWMSSIYATPDTIATLETSTAIAHHVKVDLELWGCPVSTSQVMETISFLLLGSKPSIKHDKVCLACKRIGQVCVLVTKKQPCMGPVTQTGCGALCPGVGRACYACYGPAENTNARALGNQFSHLGLSNEEIINCFQHINSEAPAFKKASTYFKGIKIVQK